MKFKSVYCFLLFLILYGSPSFVFAQITQIVVTPAGTAWTLTMDNTKLGGPGGSDFITPQESVSTLVTIDITAVPPNGRYICYISYSSVDWPSGVTLYARGTDNGVAGGGSGASITWYAGLNVYQQITTADTEFFRGRRTRTGIKVQYRIDGLSVNVPLDMYAATITYTVVDN